MPTFDATVSGNLTGAPELKTSKAGRSILDFDLAINRRRRNPETNEWEDAPATFVSVRAFDKLAENLALLSKGRAVIVTGEIVTEEWTTNRDEKRSKIKLLATAGGPDFTRAHLVDNLDTALYQARPGRTELG